MKDIPITASERNS